MINKNNNIDQKFFWLNKPVYKINNGKLILSTSANTDFWQKTHYGFERDDGHCLLTKVKEDFSVTIKTNFAPKKQYDQCGLIVRFDSNNWIKTSTEYESANRLH